MWRLALLAPLLASTSSAADLSLNQDNNTTPSVSSISFQQSIPSSTTTPSVTSPYETKDQSTHSSSIQAPRSSPSLLSSNAASSSTSRILSTTSVSVPSVNSSTKVSSSTSPSPSTEGTTRSKMTSTLTSLSKSTKNGNSIPPSSSTPCTGCALQASRPVTTFFKSQEQGPWTSILVTETIITSFITYFINSATIDTIVTKSQTVNQTKTLVLSDKKTTITHQTPVFSVYPTPGVVLTLEAGPTYVIYANLFGGLAEPLRSTKKPLSSDASTCSVYETRLSNWQPKQTDDWKYFIETYTQPPPRDDSVATFSVPSAAIEYLKTNSAIVSQFRGSDIATCTPIFRPSEGDRENPAKTTAALFPPAPAKPSPERQSTAYAAFPPTKTQTWLDTSYTSVSTYISVNGCRRCQTGPLYDPVFSGVDIGDPATLPSGRPNDVGKKPDDTIVIPPGAPIVIGTNTYTATPVKPTSPPGRPNAQDVQPPLIVIGTHTITPGGSAIIDGHNVYVPLPTPGGNGNGAVVVDGNAPVITPAPVLSVGGQIASVTIVDGTMQYAIGNQVLVPGSSVVIDDTTFALPASGSNTIIINGVPSSLNAAQSSFTLGQQYITATISAGTTSFIFNPSQTLKPGVAVTVSGTTFSMPLSASGSVVVINGVTSTLPPSPSTTPFALTINGKTYTATTRGGTAEFVLAQGVTLRPGEVVTISGTTYSLVEQGTALVVNGVTSSVARGPAANSASTTGSAGARDVGGFVWSGIGGGGGGSRSTGGAAHVRVGGLDKWIETVVIGVAGWLLML